MQQLYDAIKEHTWDCMVDKGMLIFIVDKDTLNIPIDGMYYKRFMYVQHRKEQDKYMKMQWHDEKGDIFHHRG